MQDLKNQLTEELADIEWSALVPHAQRDALIVVDESESLSIVDVGVALAEDDVPTVQRLIAEQVIYKPSTDRLSEWNAMPDRKFSALIVQPFVLIAA
jgi:hypothetical protein